MPQSTTLSKLLKKGLAFSKSISAFIKKYDYAIFLALLVVYFLYSFTQHYNVDLRGDMAQIILPSPGYEKVMNNPFGLPALLKGEEYHATNRFFAHWTMANYFRTMPFFLQNFVSPVNSVYLASGIAKTIIQAFITFLLAFYITGTTRLFNKNNLLAALLVAPLFQTFGENNSIGIIDKSIAYTFFYAFSVGMVGLFFLPFSRGIPDKECKFSNIKTLFLLILAITLPLKGPLNPALFLLIVPGLLLYKCWRNFHPLNSRSLGERLLDTFFNINPKILLIFIVVMLVSLYSMWIGQYNTEHQWATIPLIERYIRMPNGLFYMFLNKLMPALWLIFILINTLIIYHKADSKTKFVYFSILSWIGIFVLLYTILLPFGGYRDYRPLIIRRETYLPVLLALMFLFGWSSYHLILNLKKYPNPLLIGLGITGFLVFCWVADEPNYDANDCEKRALKKIIQSEQKTIQLKHDCNVMAWQKFDSPVKSKINSQVLQMWNIIDKDKRYYH